jgi:uncharacterized protein RhaS with RHS repeats
VSYFRNRMYDSRTGRWMQEDPLGMAGGINLYQFNGNDPVQFSDPFGLKCTEKQATRLKSRIRNAAEELDRRIKEYEDEPFDKLRADGSPYDHPGMAPRRGWSMGRDRSTNSRTIHWAN